MVSVYSNLFSVAYFFLTADVFANRVLVVDVNIEKSMSTMTVPDYRLRANGRHTQS